MCEIEKNEALCESVCMWWYHARNGDEFARGVLHGYFMMTDGPACVEVVFLLELLELLDNA